MIFAKKEYFKELIDFVWFLDAWLALVVIKVQASPMTDQQSFENCFGD